MPDMDTLNIINIYIHSIGVEDARDIEQYANMHTIQGSNLRQETHRDEKCCTNTDNFLKSANSNTKPITEAKADKSMEYFLAGPSDDSHKARVLNQHTSYIKTLKMF